MIISAHQPNFIPWLGFFDKVNKSDMYVVLDNVPRSRGDYLNRNQIWTQLGPHWVTVPVNSKNLMQTQIKDIRIDYQNKWQEKQLKTIKNSYSKSQYFEEIYQGISEILNRGYPYIAQLNLELIKFLLHQFGINRKIEIASNYEFGEKKDDLILEICQFFNADAHIFGQQGKNYVQEAKFLRAGIEYEYQDFKTPIYPTSHEFTANLSSLDALFHAKDFMKEYFKNIAT